MNIIYKNIIAGMYKYAINIIYKYTIRFLVLRNFI